MQTVEEAETITENNQNNCWKWLWKWLQKWGWGFRTVFPIVPGAIHHLNSSGLNSYAKILTIINIRKYIDMLYMNVFTVIPSTTIWVMYIKKVLKDVKI